MRNAVQFPPGYIPYETIVLCGNTLTNVGVIFEIDNQPLLLVGRGQDLHPILWVFGLNAINGRLEELVSANALIRASSYGQSLMVLRDANLPQTVLMVGGVVAVNAVASADGKSVNISSVDLRPLSLNIFGTDHDGLSVAGSVYVQNRFRNLAAAFATSFGKPGIFPFNTAHPNVP